MWLILYLIGIIKSRRKIMLLLDKVDQVSITILVDNHTDILLASTDNVRRPPIISKKNNGYLIQIAEHGFASLIELKYDNNSKTSKFLFDAGVSAEGLLFNANIAMDKDRQQRALRPIACILNEGHIQGHHEAYCRAYDQVFLLVLHLLYCSSLSFFDLLQRYFIN